MKIEQPQIYKSTSVESKKDIIKLTPDENQLLTNSFGNLEDNQELKKLMEQKGISFGSGDIIVEVNGLKEMMVTNKDDFGTKLDPETVENLYGAEKRKEIYG